jgi:nucleotide-binding universal stress UspA family protein
MNEPAPPRAGDWSPKSIIVGYDGTSAAGHALRRAIDLAQTFDSRVIVADVAAPPNPCRQPRRVRLHALLHARAGARPPGR